MGRITQPSSHNRTFDTRTRQRSNTASDQPDVRARTSPLTSDHAVCVRVRGCACVCVCAMCVLRQSSQNLSVLSSSAQHCNILGQTQACRQTKQSPIEVSGRSCWLPRVLLLQNLFLCRGKQTNSKCDCFAVRRDPPVLWSEATSRRLTE